MEASKRVSDAMSEVIRQSSVAKRARQEHDSFVKGPEDTLTSLGMSLCEADIQPEYKTYVKATHHLLKLYRNDEITLAQLKSARKAFIVSTHEWPAFLLFEKDLQLDWINDW